jgi:hypothetical protein
VLAERYVPAGLAKPYPDGVASCPAGTGRRNQSEPFALGFIIPAETTVMTDQQIALQAVSEAQRILEEYLEPRPHNDELILDRLFEVLERNDVVAAVSRLQAANANHVS